MNVLAPVHPDPQRLEEGDGGIEGRRHSTDVKSRVALEAALQYADTVIAVGLGDQDVRTSVRTALRMGADQGIHVDFDPVGTVLAEKYARVLARLALQQGVDAIFLPERYPLIGEEVVGLVGAELDWPSLTQVTAIGTDEVREDFETAEREVLVQRKMDIGRQEIVGLSPPAVLGISAEYANPRRGSLDTAIAGTKREIRSKQLADVAPNETPFSMCVGNRMLEDISVHGRWGKGSPPDDHQVEARILELLGRGKGDQESEGEVIDDPPAIAADQLVNRLQQADLL